MFIQDANRLTGRENQLGITKGERRVGRDKGEASKAHGHKRPLCIKKISSKYSLRSAGNCTHHLAITYNGIQQSAKRLNHYAVHLKLTQYFKITAIPLWRKKWQPTPAILPGEFHGQRSLAGYSLWGHQESGMTEQL